MHSPTTALLWDIWRRHRLSVLVIVALTTLSWILDVAGLAPRDDDGGAPPLQQLMGMCSFLLLFGVFNYTESSGETGLGRFPQRLFTLPVSSFRLVAVPVLAGTISIVLLYLLWMKRLPQGGPTSDPFIALLLAALMVFYQAGLWTLVRLGPLRLVALGAVGAVVHAIGLLPSFPPSPPPPWRSEPALAGSMASLAVIVFLVAWHHIASLRSGGGQARLLGPLAGTVVGIPKKRRGFASAASAHFWFEWRCSGMALPLLVAGILLVIIGPASWIARSDPDGTLRLLSWTLATPIAVAIPVGMAFSRPRIGSDDLSLPAFVAVRPLSADDLVATKVKVAAMSAAISSLVVLAFLGVWLSSWANLDGVSRVASRLQALYHSRYAVYGIAALIVCSGFILTWRFLVSRLWSSLAGHQVLFIVSGVSIALAAISLAVFDVGEIVRWIVAEPWRMTSVIWIAALAVIVKCSLAAYAWHRIASRHFRRYIVAWLTGTACLVTLGVLVWKTMPLSGSSDVSQYQTLTILLALLAVPIARVGLAPAMLSRNRHR